MTTEAQAQAAVDKIVSNSAKLDEIVNGSDTAVIMTGGGPVKSFANLQRRGAVAVEGAEAARDDAVAAAATVAGAAEFATSLVPSFDRNHFASFGANPAGATYDYVTNWWTPGINSYTGFSHILSQQDIDYSAAGGKFNFRIDADPTAAALQSVTCYLLRANGSVISSFALDPSGYSYLASNVTIDTDPTHANGVAIITYSIQSHATLQSRHRQPVVSYGQATTVENDPVLLSIKNRALSGSDLAKVVNAVTTVTLGGSSTKSGTVISTPYGSGATVKYSFEPSGENRDYSIMFKASGSKKTLNNLGRILIGSNGDSFVGSPVVIRCVDEALGLYYGAFKSKSRHDPSYDGQFGGVILTLYNDDATSPGMTMDMASVVISEGLYAAPSASLPPIALSNAKKMVARRVGDAKRRPAETVDFWGDSLTDYNHAGTSIPALLEGLWGVECRNWGVATQTPAQIAARYLARAQITLPSNQLPAGTSAVTVTSISPTPITGSSVNYDQYPTDPLYGTVAGVRVKLQSIRSGGAITGYSLSALQPSYARPPVVRPVAAGSFFVPDLATETTGNYQVHWEGQNTSGSTSEAAAVCDNYDAALAAMTSTTKGFAALSVLNSVGNLTGSDAFNNVLATRHPNYYIPVLLAPTAEEIAAINAVWPATNYTPSSTGNTQIAAGFIPNEMRDDSLHPNTIGNKLIALRINRFAFAAGWPFAVNV